jgi:ABC-type transport system involved in multi-copper enzyme maturation permease subunit
MTSLFRAEWQKITGHRVVTALLVWIYPVGAGAIVVLTFIGVLLSDQLRQNILNSPPDWTQMGLVIWGLVNSEMGRFLLVTFAAFVFAGEYQWGTWKNLIPRTARVPLILTKYEAFASLITAAVLLAVLISVAGTLFVSAVAGAQVVPPLSDGPALSEFAGDFVQRGLITMTSAIIAASYAAVGGMLTRSIIGGVIVGFLLQFAETAIALVTVLIEQLIPALNGLHNLFLYTPTYNLANIGSWAQYDTAYVLHLGPDLVVGPHALEASLLIVALWVVGLVGLVTWLFRRQDILG